MASPYETLGIDSSATDAEVKAAYRRMAFRWHPDRFSNGTDADRDRAHERFVEIGEAMETIMRWRASGQPKGPGSTGGAKRQGPKQKRSRPPRPPQPTDREVIAAAEGILAAAFGDRRFFGGQESWFPADRLAGEFTGVLHHTIPAARKSSGSGASATDLAAVALTLSTALFGLISSHELDEFRRRSFGFAVGRVIDGLSPSARAACYSAGGTVLGGSHLEMPELCWSCLGAPSRMIRLAGLDADTSRTTTLRLCRACAPALQRQARDSMRRAAGRGWKGIVAQPRARAANWRQLQRARRQGKAKRYLSAPIPPLRSRARQPSPWAWAAVIVVVALLVGAIASQPSGQRSAPRTTERLRPTTTTTTLPPLDTGAKFGIGLPSGEGGLGGMPSLGASVFGRGPLIDVGKTTTRTWHYDWTRSEVIEAYWRAFPAGTTLEDARRLLAKELPSDATVSEDADVTVFERYGGATHVACHALGYDSAQLANRLAARGVARHHVVASLYSFPIGVQKDPFWPWSDDPTTSTFDPGSVTVVDVSLSDQAATSSCRSASGAHP